MADKGRIDFDQLDDFDLEGITDGQILKVNATTENMEPADEAATVNKTVIFHTSSHNNNSGDYDAVRIGPNGKGEFTFAIPADFSSLISLTIAAIPNSTNATADAPVFINYRKIVFHCQGVHGTYCNAVPAAGTGVLVSVADIVSGHQNIPGYLPSLQATH